MAEPPCATEVAETLLGYLIARRVTTIITRRKRDLRENAVARNHVTSVVMAERPLKPTCLEPSHGLKRRELDERSINRLVSSAASLAGPAR